MKLAALLVLALALGTAAASRRIPEARIGLARTAPGEVAPPPVVKENESAPGERPARPRAFPGAAPVIPHGIADFLPITPRQNACVDCHAVKEKAKGEPTPIPASHYVDQRNDPGKRGDKVVGARWSCTACHVPQQDVKPLVGSPFPR
jgi:nitrate reductase (cytochrome), electron transfer subunit